MPGALLGPFGRYELGFEPVTIGRSSVNTLVIDDNLVSGRHLQVLPQGPGYMLVDVGSSNGTVLNGQRLSPQMPQALRSGDIVIIGSTRLTVELTQGAFPPAPHAAAPNQAGVAPSEQMGFSPPPAMPAQPPPNYGPPPPLAAPFPPAQPPNYGPPAQPGMPPNAFGPYPGNQPGQPPGYYPGPYTPGGPPGTYQGAPGVGVGGAPPRTRRKRLPLLIGGVLVVLLILSATGVTFFLLSHRTAQNATPPNATAQAVMPFYDSLKKQNYTVASGLFSPDYIQQLGGQQQAGNLLQQFDQLRGMVTAYHIVSVKPVSGSTSSEVALVNVTRDPAKGTFLPDTLQLAFQKGKWLISQWTPGQRQS